MAIKYGRPIEPANLYPLEAPAGRTAPILDLVHRPRRTRRTDWSRRLVRENTLTVDDLIWPIFVIEGDKTPGAGRLDARRRAAVDRPAGRSAVGEAASWASRRSPSSPPRRRRRRRRGADEAFNPDNLVCRAVRAVKARTAPRSASSATWRSIPTPATATTAWCATATSSTTRRSTSLCQQAVVQAEAGCDVIAPSDMMDGRIGAIRAGAGRAGFQRRPDHVLRRQVRLGLLRPVPRRGRLGASAGHRRQTHLPDGPGQRRRGAARGRPSTSPRAPTW